ncbi:hypothetical protein HK102_002204 [Quaeritorhiza haematococci]|nr:hypothetical protein HK102_002204 [Quaeritorhiza haematococci]
MNHAAIDPMVDIRPPATFHFDEHHRFMWFQWVAVFTALLLWGLAKLAKYIIAVYEFTQYELTERTNGEAIPSAAGPSESAPLAGPAVPTFRAPPIVSPPTVEDTEGLEDPESRYSVALARLDRATQAARTSLLLLLTVVTLTSLPIEYSCSVIPKSISPSFLNTLHNPYPSAPILPRSGSILQNPHSSVNLASAASFLGGVLESTKKEPGVPPVPVPPIVPPEKCTTCLANAVTPATTILVWTFFGLAVVFFLLEIFLTEAQSATISRLLMTLFAQPLIVAIFVIAFTQWGQIKSQTCDEMR